jgi:hypothetical protein
MTEQMRQLSVQQQDVGEETTQVGILAKQTDSIAPDLHM